MLSKIGPDRTNLDGLVSVGPNQSRRNSDGRSEKMKQLFKLNAKTKQLFKLNAKMKHKLAIWYRKRDTIKEEKEG